MRANQTIRGQVVIVIAVFFTIAGAAVTSRADCNCDDPQDTMGDIDGDGSVNPTDVSFLTNYVIKQNPAAAPVNDCDAEINGYCNAEFVCEPSLGDLLVLIYDVYHGVGDFVPCEDGVDVPTGALEYVYPGAVQFPTGTGTLAYDISLINTSDFPIDIIGYAAPVRVHPTDQLSITEVDVTYQFDHTGGWDTGVWPRSPNKTMVFAHGGDPTDPLELETIAESAYIAQWITISVSYSNPGPPATALITPYSLAPGDYEAFYTVGLTLARGRQSVSAHEAKARVSYVKSPSTAEIPSSSTAGLAVLCTFLVLSGALALFLNRRKRSLVH